MAGSGRDVRRPRERLRCRPTPDQELLLQACLLKGDDAVRAFDLWRARTDIDRLDHGSYRLLPLLYANLHDLGSTDPLTEKLKGVYRRTWYTNQLLFHRAAALVQALEEAGLKTLLFKGGALIPLHYKDPGLRPMGDFDVLVPTERATEAVRVLQRNGWRPRLLFETQRLSRDCAGFVSGGGQEVDLHWHLLEECCYEGANQPFWDNAIPLSLNGIPTRALGAADHLFYVCVHGSRWKDVPPVRWVPDALAILGGCRFDAADPGHRAAAEPGHRAAAGRDAPGRNAIDWNHILDLAVSRRLVLPVRETFNYLRDIFGAPIPSAVLETLGRESVTRSDRAVHAILSRPQPHPGYFIVTWLFYARARRGMGAPRRVLGFPRHLRNLWSLEHYWQMPGYVIGKLAERARNLRALTASGGRRD